LKAAANLAPGDAVQVVLHPLSAAAGSLPSPATRKSPRRSARRPTSAS
jgi:hypothetical protein